MVLSQSLRDTGRQTTWMKLLILTQLPPTHCGILTLISSLSMIISVQQRFFWWSFFSVSGATADVRHSLMHKKSEQLLKVKLFVFILLQYRIDTSGKDACWNVHWHTCEALKISSVAWARYWLSRLKKNQQTGSSRAQTLVLTIPPEPHTEMPAMVPNLPH